MAAANDLVLDCVNKPEIANDLDAVIKLYSIFTSMSQEKALKALEEVEKYETAKKQALKH